MSTLLLVAVLFYLLILTVITVLSSRKENSAKAYYLADNSLRKFPLAISVMMTAFSAFNFIIFPADIAKHGLYIIAALPAFLIIIYPIRNILIPIYFNQKCISTYGFLSTKSSRVHYLTSAMFILWRLTWMGFSLYATAKLLGGITGYPLWSLIVVTGFAATLYTSLGGLRTVVWSDLLQFIILIAAIVVIIAFSHKGITALLTSPEKLLKPFHPIDPAFFSFDISQRITLPSALIGGSVAFLARYGADHMSIQRYKAASSLKAAQKSFTLNIIVLLGTLILLIPFGFAIREFAAQKGMLNSPASPIMYVLRFIKAQPAGITVLIVLAMISATMSSIDSGINAISSAISEDFFSGQIQKRKRLSFSIGALAIVLGALCIPLMAKEKTLFIIVNKLINGFGAPLLAIILLSLFGRKHERGLFYGGIVGALFSLWSVWGIENISAHYYGLINFVVTVLSILCVSTLSQLKEKRAIQN